MAAMKKQPPKTSDFLGSRPPKVETLVRQYMIDKALNNPRKYDIFHPSAWGYCLRKIAYQYYNDKDQFLHIRPDEINLRYERIFDNGHGVHERWQRYLAYSKYLRGWWKCEKCGKVSGKDQPLGIFSPYHRGEGWQCLCGSSGEPTYEEILVRSDPEYNFAGHVDAVMDLRGSPYERGGDYDLFVVDFKTMKDSYFSDVTQAKYEHAVQVNIYMWLLDINGAVVVYENKDNQQLKEMFVARDDVLIEKIKEEAKWLVDVLRHRKLPDRPAGVSYSQFPFMLCEFRKICYA